MYFHLGNLLIFILTVTQDSDTLTLSDNQVSLVLYTVSKTWNEAQKTCNLLGGTLFTQDSAERGHVLSTYKGSSAWTATKDVWLGLHYPAGGSGAMYGWTTCQSLSDTQYKDWKTSEPKSGRCVVADKIHKYWVTKDCSANNYFLCETTGGSACTYLQSQQTPTSSPVFDSLTTTETNMADCWAKCLTQTYNNMNCWALNWGSGTSNCVLYFVANPFYFESSVLQASSTLQLLIKQCYSFSEEGSVSVSVPSDSSSTPDEGCSSFIKTTTTTSTTTTPTTTSLTSTTTSKASTTSTASTSSSSTPSTSTSSTSSTNSSTTTTPAATTSVTSTSTTPAATTSVTSTSTTPAATTSVTSSSTTPAPSTSVTSTSSTPAATTSATSTSTTPAATTSVTSSSTTPAPSTSVTSTSSTPAAMTSATSSSTTPAPSTSVTSTSTTQAVVTSVTSTTTSSKCLCSCQKLKDLISSRVVDPAFLNLTLAEKVVFLQMRLKLNSSDLSSTKRKKNSAKDDRTESQAIGYVGVTFLCIVFVPIVLSDTIRVLAYFHNHFKKSSQVTSSTEERSNE